MFNHLLVILGADAGAVDLDDAVAGTEVGGDGRRVGVDVADELAGLAALGVQVEPVPAEVRPLPQVAQARPRSIRRQRITHSDGRPVRGHKTPPFPRCYVRGSGVYNMNIVAQYTTMPSLNTFSTS